MSESDTAFDRSRVALVFGPHEGTRAGEVGTGYFLTGNLVLTAWHVLQDAIPPIRVRADLKGLPEKDRWSDAKVVWSGPGIDAALLRTTESFGEWTLPTFVTDPDENGDEVETGSWRSAGYAKVAADETSRERPTQGVHGTWTISGGQALPMLELSTEQDISGKWDTHWKGLSGAPVVRMPDGALLGIVVKANRKLTNALLGLPIWRVAGELGFATALKPSFLGDLPEKPSWCLVVTAEGARASLVHAVRGAITGHRNDEEFKTLRRQPVELPAAAAVESIENWARSVEALARADYVVADVTGFQPAVMTLLGIRAVLRRGVTVSVTGDDLSAHVAATPFNVRETRVLSYRRAGFFDDLHQAMRDGARSLRTDPNYLDLPAYHGVRSTRADTESAADDGSLSPLVLCPFGKDYTAFYDSVLLNVIRAQFPTPQRMLDLRSPRLVGQALYEHIRWARRCIVDWTEWKANVFFEFGVRLAGSTHDPLVVIDRTDLPDEGEIAGTGLRQRALLTALFAPLPYDRDDPYVALEGPLDAWRNAPAGSPWTMPGAALPPAGTFSVAQQSYVWTDDEALRAPDVEQQAGVERIVGRDQNRRPESLVLFAHNEHFDARLRVAVREKWIASWLYLRHLASAEPDAIADGRLLSTAQLTRRALTGSDVPRHVAVREEIARFLRDNRRSRRIAADDVLGLKASAMDARSEGDWEGAIEDLTEAVEIVLQRLPAGRGAPQPPDALAQLADLYGAVGGIERQWGLASAPDDRALHLQASVDAYDEGFGYEKQRLGTNNATTYTRLNRLVARVLVDPSVLVGDAREAVDVRRELAEVERVVQEQLDSSRTDDPWAWCDLALVRLLRNEPVDDALAILDGLRPKRQVYESALGTWRPLADAAGDVRPELHDAVARLVDAMRYAPTSSG